MTTGRSTEGLLREVAPQVLGAVVRRYGDFASAEDAVQEALLAAAAKWRTEGRPDDPVAWLIRVASRRLADQYRRNDARRRREDLAASWSIARPDPASGQDDPLIGTVPARLSRPSLSVGRELGTVVVAVRGRLDARIAHTLERVLGDLIEGQGNVRVVVDLSEADFVEAELRLVLRVPTEQARRRGAELGVRRAPSSAHRAQPGARRLHRVSPSGPGESQI